MATYEVAAPDGRRFRIDGDSPPTESDLDEIFKASPRPAAAALEGDAGFHIAPSEKPLEQLGPEKIINKGMELAGRGLIGAANLVPKAESYLLGRGGKVNEARMLKYGEPLFHLAEPLTPEEEASVPPQAAGVYRSLTKAADALTTPEMLATLPLAALKPIQAAFATQMAANIPDQVKRAADVLDDPKASTLEKWEAVTDPAISGVMTGLLAKNLAKKGVNPNAIQERSATPVPVEEPPGGSPEVGTRVPQPETPAEAQAQPNVPPKEEVAISKETSPELATRDNVAPARVEEPSSEAAPEQTGAAPAAVEAIKTGLSKVVVTDGVETAKEAKSQLVEELEKAVASAPSEEGIAPENRGTVRIEIPGDGSFKVVGTKEALSGVLQRAKKISTKSGGSSKGYKESIPTKEKTSEWMKEAATPEGILTDEQKEDRALAAKQASQNPPEHIGMGAAVPAEFSAFGPQEQRLIKALSEIPAGKEGRDSPRISVADKVGDAVAVGKDAMTKWWLRTKAGAEQYKRLLFGAPLSENDFWKNKKDWQANRQVNSGVAREMIDQGKTLFPKQLHRQAMGKYAEALMFDNPNETLAGWARDAKLAKNRQIYEAAKNLTPDQKSAVLESIRYYEKKGQELQNLGLLGKLIEDYAGQHMVDMSKNAPSSLNQLRADLVRGTFNTNFKYAMQRMFETEFDLEQSGRTLKTTDLFDKLANYAKSANDVLADRNAIKQWMDGETEDGKPLFATGQNRIPIEGEKNDALLVNPKVRPDPVWKDKNGEQQDISGEYVKIDHPAFRKWQWAETDPNGKQIFVQGDVWAHKSIADELKNTFGRSRLYDIPGVDTLTRVNSQLKGIKLVGLFHQVKTAVHAMTHLTNPWGQPKIDPHDPFTYDAMRSGLQLFEPRNAEIFSEGLSSSSVIHNIPGLGPRLRAYQEYLFQDYIPRIKLATYRNALDRNMARYGKELPEQSIKQITATQINSAYGEMNWRLLGINPTFQHFLRLALLAPDFQAAQHGFVAQMFTKTGGENRMSAAIMIAGVYTAARVLNMLFDKDPHFEPKRAFGVVIGGREYGIRTIASDAMRAYTDTSQYIYHRLSPTASSAAEFVSKVDALGRKENTKQALGNIALRGVPMPITPRRDLNFVESALASTFGYYAKRQSPISDVSEMAKKWREKNDPKYRDETVQYPISQYQSLRQALQDNDLKQARTEYEKLLKTDKPALINRAIRPYTQVRIPGTDLFENHYHPFAGSRKNEREFYNSLSDSEKKVYDRARLERLEEYRRFQKMLEARRNQ